MPILKPGPCGACKFLRRKCTNECILKPYFMHRKAVADFSTIHQVFGARRILKLLSKLPMCDRAVVVRTMTVEAQARVTDPKYGCIAQILDLQQQVKKLQAQLDETQAQLAAAQSQLACAVAPVADTNEQVSETNLNQALETNNEQATVVNSTELASLPQFSFDNVEELLVDPWFSTYMTHI